ncbi:Metallo-dependent hydrolase [Clavulina sp. PMI_390]|nr:Metallo-dependent hydrolase [Clavulina sp. PMI_390]
MPLNSIPPTTTVENLEIKRDAAKSTECFTDVGFWGGVIPGNQNDLRPLIDSGVRGFKCFMIESGVDEFPCVFEPDLVTAIPELTPSSMLMFHAELDDGVVHHDASSDPTLYSTFLSSRPPSLETGAIDLIISLHKRFPGFRGHIVHLSAADALPAIRAARADGLALTVETCFHYLCLTASSIPHGHPEFKCCPPIRDATNRDKLWEALLDGTIDCVVSDHSPCVAELKRVQPESDGDFMSAWGGISTLGLGLSLLWTEGSKRGIKPGVLISWLTTGTAKIASLSNQKGAIRAGMDADFAIFDPTDSFMVTKESLNFKNKLSPYEGLSLKGRVQQTWLRGSLTYDVAQAGAEFIEARGKLI